ncbi:hypothetical protein [Pseudarthrobacter sp. BRE9]|uniref:hypothetical protein n=1 Tax=Pseudarthrobacter sp. BRE9 TaxID=2962582 RepID=UPI00288210B7|nr:hypothetical protein [Pseudarthrobacter sp. BRE9]MDT0168668.1 hypothetical protein [Pseudarthrobacter sp. BRE9]
MQERDVGFFIRGNFPGIQADEPDSTATKPGNPFDPVGLQRIPAGKLQPSAEVLPAVAAVVVA